MYKCCSEISCGFAALWWGKKMFSFSFEQCRNVSSCRVGGHFPAQPRRFSCYPAVFVLPPFAHLSKFTSITSSGVAKVVCGLRSANCAMSKKTKTPKKSSAHGDSLTPLSPTLSPVVVSPGRSPSSGNLTGSSRKVKDAAADWHNYTDRWNLFKAQGAEVIQKMSNLKLEAIYSNERIADTEEVNQEISLMPIDMEKYSERLQSIHSSMSKLVQKLENVTRILKGVSELEWHQNNESFNEEPLFKTWQTPQFYQVSNELLAMYQKELLLKETIIQNMAHASDRATIMILTAAWIHEPYIEERVDVLIESLLRETGHR